MVFDTLRSGTIRLLIDRFYGRVREDPEIGPLYEAILGSDWEPHLEAMHQFWSSVMLGDSQYDGSPMVRHVALPRFDLALFDRWLGLFRETVKEMFTPDLAAEFSVRAERIAAGLKFGIEHHRRHNDAARGAA